MSPSQAVSAHSSLGLCLRDLDDRIRPAHLHLTRTQVAALFAHRHLAHSDIEFLRPARARGVPPGAARVGGLGFPAAWFQPLTVGIFDKALGFADLWFNLLVIAGFGLSSSSPPTRRYGSRRPEMSIEGEAAHPLQQVASEQATRSRRNPRSPALCSRTSKTSGIW